MTSGNPSLEETIDLIRRLHAGQVDKAGRPYWEHPVAVMMLLGPDADHEERLAALLHDVLEDTGTTAEELRRLGYSERVVGLVSMLTRVQGSGTYIDWIRTIAASGDAGAIRIKLADNRHNSDPTRNAALSPEDAAVARDMASGRYARSMAILEKALASLEDRFPGRVS